MKFLLFFFFSFQIAYGEVCVALRGNGNWVGAHFGAMARIVETEGRVTALAGGSSATVTSFLYESILANTSVENDDEIAFMLKSIYGYMHSNQLKLKKSFTSLSELQTSDIFRSIKPPEQNLKANLLGAFSRLELGRILSADMLDFLSREDLDLEYRWSEARKSFENLQSFDASDPASFIRPGFINFRSLASLIGYIGDYYAGEQLTAIEKGEQKKWLFDCASKTRDLSWSEIQVQVPHCARTLVSRLDHYLLDQIAQGRQSARLNHLVGERAYTLISTAVLQGIEADRSLKAAQARFYTGQKIDHLSFDFEKDVKFGYWGQSDQYRILSQNLSRSFVDAKSKKFLALGRITWREVLRLSPAEPGLAPARKFSNEDGEDFWSVGGWSDLHPVQVLKASGCDDVIYVTRKGEEALLAESASKSLGASESQRTRLYSLEHEDSAFRQALKHSRSWCTNWSDYSAGEILEMSEEAYFSGIHEDSHGC